MENALVILCGGNSTRMGTDKALLPFGDTCLIEYLVRKFQPYFSRISPVKVSPVSSRRYTACGSKPFK